MFDSLNFQLIRTIIESVLDEKHKFEIRTIIRYRNNKSKYY